jgi:hypothetical protein
MRCKTLGLSFLGSLSFVACGVSGNVANTPPSSIPRRNGGQRIVRGNQSPNRTNQPVFGNRLWNRQLQLRRDLVGILRSCLRFWALHRSIDSARVRFR